MSTPTSDNTFHDGRVVLPDVGNWHNYLHSVMRKSDTISGRVLNLVDERMLLEDPNSRLTSSDLCEKLKEILVSAKAEHSRSLTAGKANPIANTIFEALLDVDKTASSNAEEIAVIRAKAAEGTQHMSQPTTNGHSRTKIDKSLAVPQDRQKGKSKRIGKSQRLDNIPLGKVAHRAEVLETALNARDKGVEPDQTRHSATKTDVSTGSIPPHRDIPVKAESEAERAFLQGINLPLPSGHPEGSTRQLKEKCLIQTPSTSLLIPQANPAIAVHQPEQSDGRMSDVPLTTPPDELQSFNTREQPDSFPRSSDPQRSTRTGMVSGSKLPVDKGKPDTSNSPPKAPVAEQRKVDIGAGSTSSSSPLSPLPIFQTLDPSLDIVQVRQELESKRAKGLEARFASLFGKSRKDQYLRKFIKDRDIVSLLDT